MTEEESKIDVEARQANVKFGGYAFIQIWNTVEGSRMRCIGDQAQLLGLVETAHIILRCEVIDGMKENMKEDPPPELVEKLEKEGKEQ